MRRSDGDGQIAVLWSDGVERIGKLPLNWSDWDWCGDNDETVMVLDDRLMQEEEERWNKTTRWDAPAFALNIPAFLLTGKHG